MYLTCAGSFLESGSRLHALDPQDGPTANCTTPTDTPTHSCLQEEAGPGAGGSGGRQEGRVLCRRGLQVSCKICVQGEVGWDQGQGSGVRAGLGRDQGQGSRPQG